MWTTESVCQPSNDVRTRGLFYERLVLKILPVTSLAIGDPGGIRRIELELRKEFKDAKMAHRSDSRASNAPSLLARYACSGRPFGSGEDRYNGPAV